MYTDDLFSKPWRTSTGDKKSGTRSKASALLSIDTVSKNAISIQYYFYAVVGVSQMTKVRALTQ